jgi:hypothetical protein
MEGTKGNIPATATVQSVKVEEKDAGGRADIVLEQARNRATSAPNDVDEKKNLEQGEGRSDIPLSKIRSIALVAVMAGAASLNVSLSK